MSWKTTALAIVLFVFAPFFRKWIDAVVWPKILDWTSRRSQRLLEKRIEALRRFKMLFYPEPSQLFIYALRRLFLIVGMIAFLLVSLVWKAPVSEASVAGFLGVHPVLMHPVLVWVLWFILLQVFLTPFNMAIKTYQYLGYCLFSHEEEKKLFEASLNRRLICLECILEHMKTKSVTECRLLEIDKQSS